MKADEYVKKFDEYLANPASVWKDAPADAKFADPEFDASIGVCTDLLKEVKELTIKRNAKSGSAIAGVINEIIQKWNAIHRRLNRPSISINTFEVCFKEMMPDLANAYYAYLNNQRRVLKGRV